MPNYKVGDVVTRKSYGGDIAFQIVDIKAGDGNKPIYVLRGLIYRIHADSSEDDLVRQDAKRVKEGMNRYLAGASKHAVRNGQALRLPFLFRLRSRPGTVLHIDSSEDFLQKCIEHYRNAGIRPIGKLADESEQPGIVRGLLERYNPDIVVLTGHDSIRKNTGNINSLDNYRNSKYFIESVKEARSYEADHDRLCVFAGACQSYFEGIMSAGANFASSPGRVLINALDPALVSEKIALTDSRKIVTAREVAAVTITGSQGIGGKNTRGHMVIG